MRRHVYAIYKVYDIIMIERFPVFNQNSLQWNMIRGWATTRRRSVLQPEMMLIIIIYPVSTSGIHSTKRRRKAPKFEAHFMGIVFNL